MKVIIALFVCLAIVSAKICPECEKTVKSATGEQCVYDPPCCPQGSTPVQCFVDPCQTVGDIGKCKCVADYCNGCNYHLYNENWEKLSKKDLSQCKA